MPISTRELSKIAGVSEQTVRNYTRDYAELLSPQARGEQGNRLFDDADVQTFCAIADLRRAGVPPSEVIERLSRGDVYIDATPNAPQATPNDTDGPQAQLLALTVQRDLERRIEAVERTQRLLEAERATERRNDKLQGALWGIVIGLATAAVYWLTLYLNAVM